MTQIQGPLRAERPETDAAIRAPGVQEQLPIPPPAPPDAVLPPEAIKEPPAGADLS